MSRGWRGERHRHALAAKGVPTKNWGIQKAFRKYRQMTGEWRDETWGGMDKIAEDIAASGLWKDEVPNHYGGIPSWGGYGAYTEYEIGAGHMAEAAHCILGAMQDTIEMDRHVWHKYAHIQEELDLIEGDLEEYSRDIYNEPHMWSKEYGQMSLESMRENSPKLKARAEKLWILADQDETISQKDKRVLLATYDFISHLAENVEESARSVEKPPIPAEKNAYDDYQLKARFYKIKEAVEEAFPEEAKR